MKLIHCADLHLDSKMSTNFDRSRAKERNAEILHTFERMIDYADQNGVTAILIAGDLFDAKRISATTRNTVLFCIQNYPKINFYYLRGNHDNDNFLTALEEIPTNLKLFKTKWTTYIEGNISISGIELNQENFQFAHTSFVLDANRFNIVVLHGQETEHSAKDSPEMIPLKAFRNKGIDYLALGHVHTYKVQQLDARGVYCYAGCLEGRGFDECGTHGFVLLDVDEKTGKFSHEFIPFSQRTLYAVRVDVTGCQNTAEMAYQITLALQKEGYSEESLIKIILIGELDIACEKNIDYLQARFRQSFYYVKVYDETSLKINTKDFLLDESLKGEFVRLVMGDKALKEEDKKAIIRYGLQAIAGEEV